MVVVIVTAIVIVAAIAFVWSSIASGGTGTRDRQPGSILDADEDVRRIDLGTNHFVAQHAEAELVDAGLTVRVVSFEEGAIGIGLGTRYYLVYNAGDEAEVTAVVDALLDDD